MSGKKIFLLGFMGSGKSLLGRMLAEELNYRFVDTDETIEKFAFKSIPEIFESRGEDYFRSLEKIVFEQVSAVPDNCVIATGGGFPCFHDLMNQMNLIGTTIYLKASPDLIYERIKDQLEQRPLFKNIPDPKSHIRKMLSERTPVYTSAQHHLMAEGDPEQIVAEIRRLLN